MARRKSGFHNHYKDTGFIRGSLSVPKQSLQKVTQELASIGNHVLVAAKDALKKEVDKIVADAKNRAPVYMGNPAYLPQGATAGALKESIHAVANKDGTQYTIGADANVPNKNANGGEGVFYYAPIVEFSPRINKPYLYPAFDANRDSAIAAIEQAIYNAIKGRP